MKSREWQYSDNGLKNWLYKIYYKSFICWPLVKMLLSEPLFAKRYFLQKIFGHRLTMWYWKRKRRKQGLLESNENNTRGIGIVNKAEIDEITEYLRKHNGKVLFPLAARYNPVIKQICADIEAENEVKS